MPGRVTKTIINASLILYGISLFLPAYTPCLNLQTEGPMPGQTMGWHALLFGWLGPIGLEGLVGDNPDRAYPPECTALLPALDLGRWREISSSSLSWFANPLWWLCIYHVLRQRDLPAISATLAAVLALLALQPHQTWLDGSVAAEIPGAGAYVWAIAVSLPLVACIASRVTAPRTAAELP